MWNKPKPPLRRGSAGSSGADEAAPYTSEREGMNSVSGWVIDIIVGWIAGSVVVGVLLAVLFGVDTAIASLIGTIIGIIVMRTIRSRRQAAV